MQQNECPKGTKSNTSKIKYLSNDVLKDVIAEIFYFACVTFGAFWAFILLHMLLGSQLVLWLFLICHSVVSYLTYFAACQFSPTEIFQVSVQTAFTHYDCYHLAHLWHPAKVRSINDVLNNNNNNNNYK